MVTGDLLNTAKSIARQCNILTKDGTAMEGKVFRNLSDQEAYTVLPKLQVLARSSPQVRSPPVYAWLRCSVEEIDMCVAYRIRSFS
jgi:Ca2+-transporting ATPase